MSESGYYPAGTEHDPRAPWNAVEVEVACEECGHASTEQDENDTCEMCEEGKMREYEPAEPCRCKSHCYC